MMNSLRRSAIAAAAAVALAASGTNALAQDTETVVVGSVGSGSALSWPVYIGMAKGFFEDAGVTLDIVSVNSSAAVQQQVAAGAVDMGGSGLVDAIRAIDQGAPVTILMIEARVGPYAMIAQPEITDWAGLKGGTISIGGAKDITRIYAEAMLQPNSLADGDYDFVYAGSTAARFAALEAGAVQAAILTAPFNFRAEGEGYTNLGLTMDYGKDFPFTGYSVNTNWAEDHGDAVRGYLAGYSTSVAYFYDPANRDEALQILVDRTGASPDDAAKTYDFFQKLHIYTADGAVEGSGIETLLSIMKEFGELDGATDVARFYDESLR